MVSLRDYYSKCSVVSLFYSIFLYLHVTATLHQELTLNWLFQGINPHNVGMAKVFLLFMTTPQK